MDTCERYELHELYKNKLKGILCDFAIDMIQEIKEVGLEKISVSFVENWVDDHVRPSRFEKVETRSYGNRKIVDET